jgi:hypothetical protein
MKKIFISFIFLISISGIFSHDVSELNKLLNIQANAYLLSDYDSNDSYRNSENILDVNDNDAQIHNLNREKLENDFKSKRGHIWKRMVRKIDE